MSVCLSPPFVSTPMGGDGRHGASKQPRSLALTYFKKIEVDGGAGEGETGLGTEKGEQGEGHAAL